MLGVTAFVLLAAALCGRSLLSEEHIVTAVQLASPPQPRSTGTLMARHLAHLLAAGGIGLGALWFALSRRRWRWTGVQVGALVLVAAALLSVPVASDKRLAINAAIDMILPLIAAAALYQMVVHRSTWRQALLAGVVAVAVAQCGKATHQKYWQFRRNWDNYQQNKVEFWSRQGIPLNDPKIAEYEAANRAPLPMGFIRGANVFSTFLLLGLAATGAAAASCPWRRARGRPVQPNPGDHPPTEPPETPPPGVNAGSSLPTHAGGTGRAPTPLRRKAVLLVIAILAALPLWHLAALSWIHTVGSTIGLLAALAAGAAMLRLRDRPARLAVLLAGSLVLLQTGLLVLALSPVNFRLAIRSYTGPGRKIGSLGARFFIYEGAVRLFLAHPLTGTGPSHFSSGYVRVRSWYVPTVMRDSHNWLLTVAAEWGALGVLGLLIALGGSGWCIVRALARPPDDAPRPVGAVLMPAVLIVLACWLILAFDLPPSQWSEIPPFLIALSVAAAVLVTSCRLNGGTGQVILLAGLVGFFVHCTAETSAGYPGVMWPFWAIVALAMAWKGIPPEISAALTPTKCRISRAGLVLAGAAALAVGALTARPMRAVHLMHRAQRVMVQQGPEQAVGWLRAAAAADPLDPLPLKVATILRNRLGQRDPARAGEHHRDCVALAHAAEQRDPLNPGCWETLALANMWLATETSDFALVDEAVQNMRKALELSPFWPPSWVQLARMAAVEDDTHPDEPRLLRTAIEAADKALALDDAWPVGWVSPLTAQGRADLVEMRKRLVRRLAAVSAGLPATEPSH
jgi:hypothetical protein